MNSLVGIEVEIFALSNGTLHFPICFFNDYFVGVLNNHQIYLPVLFHSTIYLEYEERATLVQELSSPLFDMC